MTTHGQAATQGDLMPAVRTGLLVKGRAVDGRAGPLPVTNPATGEAFVHVAGASAEDIDEAVRVADETFRSGVWRDVPIHDRAARLIHRSADGIEAG